MLQPLLILGVPILIAGVLGGLVAAFAGLTGTAYELAEAATVLTAGPLILRAHRVSDPCGFGDLAELYPDGPKALPPELAR